MLLVSAPVPVKQVYDINNLHSGRAGLAVLSSVQLSGIGTWLLLKAGFILKEGVRLYFRV
jgi:hypothetical protein